MVLAIPTVQDFVLLREAYFTAKQPSHDPHDTYLKETVFRESFSGARIDFEVRQNEYGRGLFAAHNVPPGTPVWNNEHYGIFHNETEWNTFKALLEPRLQQDVAVWSYVLEWDTDTYAVSLDLEHSSLMNNGSTNPRVCALLPHCAESNLQLVQDKENGDTYYAASRYIHKGEEILVDYGSFHAFDHNLSWFRDGWDNFVHFEAHNIASSKGMLGSYPYGTLIGRNGDALDDYDSFGKDWQVDPAVDPKLFGSLEGVQLPHEQCVLPPNHRSIRERLLVSEAEATKACKVVDDFEDCVFDVFQTGDVTIVEEYL